MLAEKQEVARRFTMTRRVDNYYCGITPLDGRYVLRSEDTDHHKQQVLINAAKEVPFLITASELRDRKNKRRQKRGAEKSLRREAPPPA
jgi:hypothetical protein